jgi:hypothetical protein
MSWRSGGACCRGPQGRGAGGVVRRRGAMADQEQAELRMRVARLELEHEDYGHAIDALVKTGSEPLRIQRFKKKKLVIKDEIAKLRSRIIPDIIA